jgi:hypothetical protein
VTPDRINLIFAPGGSGSGENSPVPGWYSDALTVHGLMDSRLIAGTWVHFPGTFTAGQLARPILAGLTDEAVKAGKPLHLVAIPSGIKPDDTLVARLRKLAAALLTGCDTADQMTEGA